MNNVVETARTALKADGYIFLAANTKPMDVLAVIEAFPTYVGINNRTIELRLRQAGHIAYGVTRCPWGKRRHGLYITDAGREVLRSEGK